MREQIPGILFSVLRILPPKSKKVLPIMEETKIELTSKILEGNVLAAARLMRGIEDEVPSAIEELQKLYPHTGKAYIVGITGAPGAGKSTVIDCLINNFRKKKMTVGVIAVDPTSPFTGGAILGDRIRMQSCGVDKDVFIRSLATRGWMGGLSKATLNMVHVMDAMGKDIIIVETVGSGQAETDIIKVADTSILILTPGMGDEIQMMKAGMIEAADIFAINKADREGADNLKIYLEVILGMRTHPSNDWKTSIVLTEATCGKGTDELVEEILKHREFLTSSGEFEKRRREKAKLEVVMAVEGHVRTYINERINKEWLEELVDELVNRKTSPHAAALKIFNLCTNQP